VVVNSTAPFRSIFQQLRCGVFLLAGLVGPAVAVHADPVVSATPAMAYPFDAGRETRETAKAAPSSTLDSRAAFITATSIAAQIKGARVMTVAATGSMRPMFDEKAYLVVEPASFENLQIGDVVTYVHPKVAGTVVHRIVEKRGDRFWTKGDFNSHMDSVYVTRENYSMRVCAVVYGRDDSRATVGGSAKMVAQL
jgi:signal peptidase I